MEAPDPPATVSFRPTREEAEIIEKVRKRAGLATRTDALRYLIRRGAEATGSLKDEPVFRFRASKGQPTDGKTLTSRRIDDELYG